MHILKQWVGRQTIQHTACIVAITKRRLADHLGAPCVRLAGAPQPLFDALAVHFHHMRFDVARKAYFTIGRLRLAVFYGGCLMMGFSTGYWAFVIAVGGWQFGTNLRATAVTTTPNAVRGNGDFSRVSGEQSVPLHVGR